jgi:hypothetical protein
MNTQTIIGHGNIVSGGDIGGGNDRISKKSVTKLLDAGYVFLRKRDMPDKSGCVNYTIMQSKHFGAWTLLEKFKTKTARECRLNELDNQPFFIVEK